MFSLDARLETDKFAFCTTAGCFCSSPGSCYLASEHPQTSPFQSEEP